MPTPRSQTTRSRRRQSDRRAETRQKLLGATVASLVEHGFAGTTVDTIASAAGVTRGALNHHFNGKTAVILAAMSQVTEQAAGRLSDAFGSIVGEGDAFLGIVRALWQSIYSAPSFVARLEVLLAARSQPEILAQMNAELLRGHLQVHDILSAALQRLENAPSVPKSAVDLALTTLRGMALEVVVRQDPDFVNRQLGLLADALRLLTPRTR